MLGKGLYALNSQRIDRSGVVNHSQFMQTTHWHRKYAVLKKYCLGHNMTIVILPEALKVVP